MKILGRTLLVTGRAIYRVDDHGHLDFVYLSFSSLIDRPISDLNITGILVVGLGYRKHGIIIVIIPACKIYGNNGLIIFVQVCPSAGPILRSYEQDHDRIGAKV